MNNNDINRNNEIKAEMKKENHKSGTVFAVIMVAALFTGFVLSAVLNILHNTSNLNGIAAAAYKACAPYYGWAALAVAVIMTTIAAAKHISAKKLYKSWDGEDEELIERCEKKLGVSNLIVEIMLIAVYALFGVNAIVFSNMKNDVGIGLILVTMLIAMAAYMTILKTNIDLFRTINPEKQGSAFDLDLGKKLEQSCDEAEKLAVYRAGYKAYRISSRMYLIGWIIFMILGLLTKMSMIPMIVIMLMWLISTIAYHVESGKKQ